jgi:hypothetical protein
MSDEIACSARPGRVEQLVDGHLLERGIEAGIGAGVPARPGTWRGNRHGLDHVCRASDGSTNGAALGAELPGRDVEDAAAVSRGARRRMGTHL